MSYHNGQVYVYIYIYKKFNIKKTLSHKISGSKLGTKSTPKNARGCGCNNFFYIYSESFITKLIYLYMNQWGLCFHTNISHFRMTLKNTPFEFSD